MKREKLPEKVPIWLTKIFTNVMDGKVKDFLKICQKVLKILR